MITGDNISAFLAGAFVGWFAVTLESTIRLARRERSRRVEQLTREEASDKLSAHLGCSLAMRLARETRKPVSVSVKNETLIIGLHGADRPDWLGDEFHGMKVEVES